MNHIQVKNIAVGYDNIQIIQDISVQFHEGEITAIIGPNGCGKSTLLKAITRIIPHAKGAVYLDGEAIAKMKTKDLAKKMAILPQVTESPAGLRVGQLV